MTEMSSLDMTYLSAGVTSPEAQLWAAVLHLALLDAAPYAEMSGNYTYEQRHHGRQALNWVLSEHCMIGSFRWVCDLLKLDRMEIRGYLMVDRSRIW